MDSALVECCYFRSTTNTQDGDFDRFSFGRLWRKSNRLSCPLGHAYNQLRVAERR